MNRKQLQEGLKNFERSGRTSEELNSLRSEIFNSLDSNEIRTSTKDSLLKDLYKTASLKGIFFLRVMERNTSDLPKNEAEELARKEAEEEGEESYEESYDPSYDESYDESYEEDEEDA
jgi:hypothetical protein